MVREMDEIGATWSGRWMKEEQHGEGIIKIHCDNSNH